MLSLVEVDAYASRAYVIDLQEKPVLGLNLCAKDLVAIRTGGRWRFADNGVKGFLNEQDVEVGEDL
jgi:hypothetical protein